MLQLIYSIFGIMLGILIGLIPGFHPNNVIPMLLNVIQDSEILSVIIVSLSLTYSFSSFLSAILFNIPDSENFLSIDSARKLVKIGLGYKAIIATIYGGLLSFILSLLLLPILYFITPTVYKVTIKFLPIFLVLFSFMIFYLNKNKDTIILFIASGLLGYATLNLNIPSYQKLSAMLTGLFGLPYVVIAIVKGVKTYNQKIDKNIKARIFVPSLIGTFAAILSIFFPSLSPAILLVPFLSLIKLNTLEFLIAIGSLTTADFFFSFFSIFTTGNPRSGSAIYLIRYGTVDWKLFFGVSLVSLPIIYFLLTFIAKTLIKLLFKLRKYLKVLNILVLIILIFMFKNPILLLILFTSTSLGILSLYLKAPRYTLMGSIIIPLILSYYF